MNLKQKQIIFLIFLVILLFAINYPLLNNTLESFLQNRETVIVQRIIDGDTIQANNKSIRLLGINSPERGEKYYTEAKIFLEDSILNKKVEIEYYGQDRYYRDLAYIFSSNKNINIELVKQGFANVYLLDNKIYKKELTNAWESCIKSNKNLCKKSDNKCADCVKLKNFDDENEITIFENICEFDCDLNNWWIKDEGRKEHFFEDFVLKRNSKVSVIVGEGKDTENILYWKNQDYVWTQTGDTLFLRDEKGNLVLWESY